MSPVVHPPYYLHIDSPLPVKGGPTRILFWCLEPTFVCCLRSSAHGHFHSCSGQEFPLDRGRGHTRGIPAPPMSDGWDPLRLEEGLVPPHRRARTVPLKTGCQQTSSEWLCLADADYDKSHPSSHRRHRRDWVLVIKGGSD